MAGTMAEQLLLTMNRRLQHASIALDKDDSPTSALFPYLISVAVCVVCVGLALQYAYLWVCRVYFGRVEPVEPVAPLSGEEILANLSEDQRRAVLRAILSKVCKAATDSDISQHIQKRSDTENDLPITDLEIPASSQESRDTDAVTASQGKGGLPIPRSADSNSEDLSGEDKIITGSLNDTAEDHQSEGSRSVPEEGDAEDNVVDASIHQVALDAVLNMCTASPYQTDEAQGNKPFDIEEGTDMRKVTDEDGNHVSASSKSPLPTCDRARSSTVLSSDGSTMVGYDVCSICLGDYNNGNMLFVSKHCGHIFHVDCIFEWLTKHEECPICRVKMVSEEEMVTAAMAWVDKTNQESE